VLLDPSQKLVEFASGASGREVLAWGFRALDDENGAIENESSNRLGLRHVEPINFHRISIGLANNRLQQPFLSP
jgi:hypothetical protein